VLKIKGKYTQNHKMNFETKIYIEVQLAQKETITNSI